MLHVRGFAALALPSEAFLMDRKQLLLQKKSLNSLMLSSRNLLFLILGSVMIFGCSTGVPEPSGTTGYIITDKRNVYFHGDILILEGYFFNDQGLKRIEIINEELDIYFELDLQGQLAYDLKLERKLPLLQTPELHEVLIILTDVNTEVRTFSYEVDYVFYPKIFNMKFFLDRMNASKRNFQGRLEDPHGIKSFTLHSLRIGELINIQFPEKVYFYDLNEDFWFPQVETFGEYPLTLQIINQRGFNLTIINFEGILGD